MQVTTRFTIAIHTMICIAHFSEKRKVTSDFIALSTNSNPVVIRRILGQLKAAELVSVRAGVGGATLTRSPEDITLYDIFIAVEAISNDFFNFHENPNCNCPVGKNIHTVLDCHLSEIQNAMTEKMKSITLAKLLIDTEEFLEQ